MRICFGSTMSNGRKSFRICRRTNLALRKDDRRILSGIMHVLKIGCRWEDCPEDYGPHKTIYNRFARWSERGVWQKIFECVATPADPPEQVALDSSHVKAHRCAHGGKGGPIFRRSGSRKAVKTARFMRSSTNSADPGPSFSRPATPPIARWRKNV